MNSFTSQNCNESNTLPLEGETIVSKSTKISSMKGKDRVYVEPTENDVLRGRGGRINAHPGKQRLLDLVRTQGERYAVLKRGQKGRLGKEIVDMVHAWGGRFLEMEKGDDGVERYYILDLRASVKLVEQKFRDDPSKRKPKSFNQSKRVVKDHKRVAHVPESDAILSILSVTEHQCVEDEGDRLVEMELRQDIFSSPHSRRAIATKVNEALSNLELTAEESDQRYHCVSPTNSFEGQSSFGNKTAKSRTCDEESLSDSSSNWNDTLVADPFVDLDPKAFFTDDFNELDEMYKTDLFDLEVF